MLGRVVTLETMGILGGWSFRQPQEWRLRTQLTLASQVKEGERSLVWAWWIWGNWWNKNMWGEDTGTRARFNTSTIDMHAGSLPNKAQATNCIIPVGWDRICGEPQPREWSTLFFSVCDPKQLIHPDLGPALSECMKGTFQNQSSTWPNYRYELCAQWLGTISSALLTKSLSGRRSPVFVLLNLFLILIWLIKDGGNGSWV